MFWYESSPLQWNRIARTVAVDRRLDAWEQARLFGLLNMALTDGYIGSFATKYEHKYWRPVTAIRLGGSDGNPGTAGDPSWTPLMPTPDIPDYDSGHAVQGGTAAAENGLSRILIGFHFREAVEVGIEHGRKIGDRAVARFMRPTRR